MKVDKKAVFLGLLFIAGVGMLTHKHPVKEALAFTENDWERCKGGRWCKISDIGTARLGPKGNHPLTYYYGNQGSYIVWRDFGSQHYILSHMQGMDIMDALDKSALNFVAEKEVTYITWTNKVVTKSDLPWAQNNFPDR